MHADAARPPFLQSALKLLVFSHKSGMAKVYHMDGVVPIESGEGGRSGTQSVDRAILLLKLVASGSSRGTGLTALLAGAASAARPRAACCSH